MNSDKNVVANFTRIYTVTVAKDGNSTGSVTSIPAGIDCGITCSTTFLHGTVVTLTAAPAEHTVVGWSGDCVADGSSCITTVTAAQNVTATFSLITYTVSVAKEGNGANYGGVTSDPSGIDCGLTCSDSYDYGTPITLTAAPNTGATFSGWAGDCTSGGLTCTTTVTGTRDVTATFTLITYTLSVSSTDNGSVTSVPGDIDCGETCSDDFDYDTVVTLTASPDTGYYLSGWEGDCTADDLTCVTTITGTRNVTATFDILTYTLSVAKDGNGADYGTVTADPEGIDCGLTCSDSYDYNTPVTLTAEVITGAIFSGWTGDCVANGSSCRTTITGTRDVTATFTLITYTVAVSKTGFGSGSITSDPSGIDCGVTCSETFDYNTVVTLTASPDTGYYLIGWEGDCSADGLSCSTTVTGARNVTATFGVLTYTLDVYKDGDSDGIVTSDPSGIDCGLTCTATYDYGTVVTLSQQTITGTAFGGWAGDCTGSGPCVVTILGNQSVTATFNIITADLGVSQSVTRSIGTITFTVVVTNGGPADADGAIISDTVTSEINDPQWACEAGNGASCPVDALSLSMVSSGVYSLYAALPDFPAGGIITYTISSNVGLLAQRLTNVAQVIAPTGVTDVNQPDDFSTLISGYRVMFPVVIKGD